MNKKEVRKTLESQGVSQIKIAQVIFDIIWFEEQK